MKRTVRKTAKKTHRKISSKTRIKEVPVEKKPDLIKKTIDIVLIAIVISIAAAVFGLVSNGIRKAFAPEKKAVVETIPEPVAEPTAVPVNTPVVIKKPVIAAEYAHLLNSIKTKEEMPKIHVAEAKALFESGRALFVDARGEGEYNESHIKDAVSIPAGSPPERIQGLSSVLKNKVLITYCHGAGCHLADKTANALFDAGYRKVAVFFGGWPEWTQASLPVQSYEPPEEYKPFLAEAASENDIKELNLEQFKFLYDKSMANIMDVDETEKFSTAHIVKAVSIPLAGIENMLANYDGWLKQKTTVIYSRDSRQKAKETAVKLYRAGYKKIIVFVMDITEWEKAGYPAYRAPQQGR